MESSITNHHQVLSINILNDDILKRIFDYLHFDDKIRLRRTCHRWRVLLDERLHKTKALRIGQFNQGAYHVTSGLLLKCEHQSPSHRQHTGTLFNYQLMSFPADLETNCFSIKQYDQLHRSMKLFHRNITMLSLGRLRISNRLLMVIAHNLPNLEHLEMIGCASDKYNQDSNKKNVGLKNSSLKIEQEKQIPSLENFNSPQNDQAQSRSILSNILYNQNQDELVNMEERLIRANLIKNCDLVKGSRIRNYWPNLKHLLVKDCNLLNEFSLSIILAITGQTISYLALESNQYLTGEFLNYCGPQLKTLRVKHCPLMQIKFLEDFVKIKQFLAPSSNKTTAFNNHRQQHLQDIERRPVISNLSMIKTFNQDIYCEL